MSLCSHLRGSRGELQRQVCEERQVQEGANQVFLRLYDPQPEEILELAAGGAGSFTACSRPDRKALLPRTAVGVPIFQWFRGRRLTLKRPCLSVEEVNDSATCRVH